MVIADPFLHKSSIHDFLVVKFPEKNPKNGPPQVTCDALNRSSAERGYRVKCYLVEIAREIWMLDLFRHRQKQHTGCSWCFKKTKLEN